MSDDDAILVVEDDLDVREAVVEALADAGYRVITAANGHEALERLRGGARPRVILLDLMMPVMDGWQFRDEQQRDPALAAIPVVALSAHGDFRSLNAEQHLRKPVKLDVLLETVASYFDGRGR